MSARTKDGAVGSVHEQRRVKRRRFVDEPIDLLLYAVFIQVKVLTVRPGTYLPFTSLAITGTVTSTVSARITLSEGTGLVSSAGGSGLSGVSRDTQSPLAGNRVGNAPGRIDQAG